MPVCFFSQACNENSCANTRVYYGISASHDDMACGTVPVQHPPTRREAPRRWQSPELRTLENPALQCVVLRYMLACSSGAYRRLSSILACVAAEQQAGRAVRCWREHASAHTHTPPVACMHSVSSASTFYLRILTVSPIIYTSSTLLLCTGTFVRTPKAKQHAVYIRYSQHLDPFGAAI